MAETNGEDLSETCKKMFREKLGIKEDLHIEKIYRVERKMSGWNRPIIVGFYNMTQKMSVLRKRNQLKGTKIFFNEDLCSQSRKRRGEMMPILRELRKTDNRAHMRGDGIFTGGRLYKNARDMPINTHKAVTKTRNGITVFRGGFSMLSNEHKVNITVEGKEWNTVQQYISYHSRYESKDLLYEI